MKTFTNKLSLKSKKLLVVFVLVNSFGPSLMAAKIKKTVFTKAATAATVSAAKSPSKVAVKAKETRNSITAAMAISSDYIENAIAEAAREFDVPHQILRAICMTESNLKATAFVFNDGGEENHAFGLCQVLRATAEKFGVKDEGCRRDFRDTSLTRSYKECKLFGVKTNALIAARYLRKKITLYRGDFFKAVASYNAGSVRTCPEDGWSRWRGEKLHACVPGGLLNRYYIKRVNKFIVENNTHDSHLWVLHSNDIRS